MATPNDQADWLKPDDHDTTLKTQQLLAHVAARREQAEREWRRMAPEIERRIEAQLSAASVVFDALEEALRHIAEDSDLALDGESRQVAVWMLSGRLIGLGRAASALLMGGFAAEVAPTLRVMHETSRVLHTVADRQEVALLERWLEDHDTRYVRPRDARAAIDRTRLRVAASTAEMLQGVEAIGFGPLVEEYRAAAAGLAEAPDDADFLAQLSRPIYDGLSRVAHARRSGMADSHAAPLRQFVSGPHPDPSMRATYVEFSSSVFEEAVLAIGDGLTSAFWPGYFIEQMLPLVNAVKDVRAKYPLA